MKGPSVALLVSLIGLVGCAGHVELPFKSAIVVDHLEGRELSFVNEDGGRQTRLELTSGAYPSEHTLALARACAA